MGAPSHSDVFGAPKRYELREMGEKCLKVEKPFAVRTSVTIVRRAQPENEIGICPCSEGRDSSLHINCDNPPRRLDSLADRLHASVTLRASSVRALVLGMCWLLHEATKRVFGLTEESIRPGIVEPAGPAFNGREHGKREGLVRGQFKKSRYFNLSHDPGMPDFGCH